MVEPKKKFKTVNIKGKEYVEVNERVKYFRKEYGGWRIESELLANDGGVCVFRAMIKDDAGEIISTGHAFEKESSSFINKTSYIENCETSAVGRALGFLGIGIDTSIASSEEVANAINNQPGNVDFNQVREKLKTINSIEALNKYWKELGLNDKQAAAIKKDFVDRKVEIGVGVSV